MSAHVRRHNAIRCILLRSTHLSTPPCPMQVRRALGSRSRLFTTLACSRPARAPQDDRLPEQLEAPAGSATAQGGDDKAEAPENKTKGSEKKGDSKSSGVVKYEDEPGEAGLQLWPYLSTMDAALSRGTSGTAWPFTPRPHGDGLFAGVQVEHAGVFGGVVSSPLDLALLAGSIAQLPDGLDREVALEALHSSGTDALLPKCSAAVLSSIIGGMILLPSEANCQVLLLKTVGELLQRRPLRPLHVARLLGSLRIRGSDGSPLVPPLPVLRLAAETLTTGKGKALDFVDVVRAYEGLSCSRTSIGVAEQTLVVDVAVALLPCLEGGPGLVRHLVSPRSANESKLVLKLLDSWRTLPEVFGKDHVAASLGSLRGVYWPVNVTAATDERTIAGAACALARCGAWLSSRYERLLTQALRKEQISPSAASLWLCAIAQSGMEMPELDKLLDAVEVLAADENSAWTASQSLTAARMLWALCTLGKTGERNGIGATLLNRLAAADSEQFGQETWSLLHEIRNNMSADENAEEDVFKREAWESRFNEISAAWSEYLKASGRLEELSAAVGHIEGDDDIADIQQCFAAGPYSLALHVGSQNMAIDFDAHESVVNRALRRQQWATLAPDVRVEEITCASWDELDRRRRVDLVRRRILGIADEAEGGDDD